jgi:poly-gamma-glutamate synthesis protein (capsule biosynthesis protein)
VPPNRHLAIAGWLTILAGAFLSACADGEPALPSTVRIYVDPPLADRALAVASEYLSSRGLTAEAAPDTSQADLVVSTAPELAGERGFAAGYWVPAVALPHSAHGLTMAQLGDALSGNLADWSPITGESVPLRVLLPTDPSPPIGYWWPDITPAAETMPLADIPAAAAADPGALALLPLDAVDARVRSLAVGGTNIVFGTGDPGSYPLTELAWMVPREVESAKFAQLLGQLATEIGKRSVVPPPDPIILRATGDIIPARCAYAKQRDYGDFRHAFLEVGPWLAQADITVGSLDAALSDAGVPFGCVDTFSLMAPAASVEGLAYSGFDVITVATNHVKDCGQAACGDQAFFDTLANLRANGIAPVGGGADLAAARKPAILTVDGVRFAFLGYDEIAPYYHAEPGVPGTAPLAEAYVREDVAAAAQQADVVVVLPQWGVEYTADPTFAQQALAAAAVKAGAGMVIGNHPHWVEAAEVIDDAFVAYALGNFVFDQDWSVETQQGVVLEAAFHGAQLKGIEYYPIRILDEHQPVFAGPEEARQILDRIWTASAALP